MQILDCEQGTPEWHQARAGIITCSCLSDVMAKGEGKTRRTYMYKLIGEVLTGEPCEGFSNKHTERGHEHEPWAREAYEHRNIVEVQRAGLILNHGIGYSPDGLVDDDGAVEIKSKMPHILLDLIFSDKTPAEHMKQMQGGLWVSEREWIDFVAFWPSLPLYVKRVYRDEKLIQEMQQEVTRFYDEMNELINKLKAAS